MVHGGRGGVNSGRDGQQPSARLARPAHSWSRGALLSEARKRATTGKHLACRSYYESTSLNARRPQTANRERYARYKAEHAGKFHGDVRAENVLHVFAGEHRVYSQMKATAKQMWSELLQSEYENLR